MLLRSYCILLSVIAAYFLFVLFLVLRSTQITPGACVAAVIDIALLVLGILGARRFKAKPAAPAVASAQSSGEAPANPAPGDEYILDMRHTPSDSWQQYDFLLSSRYGWAYMLSSAQYMAEADLDQLGTVTTSSHAGARDDMRDYARHVILRDFPN